MTSYVNFAVAEAHRQDLLRAAERSHLTPKSPRLRFNFFDGLRSAASRQGKRRVAGRPEVAVARVS